MSDQLSADLASLRIRRDEPPPRGPWITRIVILLVVLGALATGYVWGLPLIKAQIFRPEVAVTEVAVVSPAQASVDLTSTGYVVPQVIAKVGAKVMGRITKVNVKEGDTVKAGQVLFELDPTEQKTAIASAHARVAAAHARAQAMRANLAEITQQWERQKRLVQSGAVAAATAEDLGARVKALEESVKAADAETHAAAAEVTTLNTGLKNMVIVAPIDGTAVTKPFAVGDVVSMMAPTPLVELADFTSLLIETDVPEARLHLVKEGGPCEIVLDAFPDKRYRGVVQEVSPKLNRSKATGTAKVKLVDQPERIRPEMSARVSFLAKALQEAEMKAPPRKIVPGAAVVDRGGTKVVFVVDGGRVRLVNVVLGEPVGSGFELKEGPGAGTRLVKDPPAALKDGEQIKERSS